MTSDLFVFKDANNLENQIEQLENTIFEKRKSEYNNNLESINKSIETTKKRKEKTQQEIQELKEKIEKLEKETNTTTTAPLALALDTRTIAPGVLKNDKKKEPTIEELKKDLEKKEKQLEQFDENVKKYEKDIEDLPQKSNDKKFLEFHAKNQYNERLKESLNEINKDGWKIVRFSMRGIYEQE
ncbi:hypothetical protein V2P31_04700 [Mycoplasma mycoides subsp. mycoides]